MAQTAHWEKSLFSQVDSHKGNFRVCGITIQFKVLDLKGLFTKLSNENNTHAYITVSKILKMTKKKRVQPGCVSLLLPDTNFQGFPVSMLLIHADTFTHSTEFQ